MKIFKSKRNSKTPLKNPFTFDSVQNSFWVHKVTGIKGTGRSEEVEISRNITFSEKILIESCGIWEDVDEIFCQNSS